MSNELKAAIQKWCEKLEIPLVGVASVDRWKEPPFQPWMPEEFYPQSIYPEARSVIVIGLPISLPVLETSPSVYYRELYSTVNSLLDQYTYRLASYLTQLGHPSVFVPRDGYIGIRALLKNPVAIFSHRHAAFLAGLGSFGVNNMLLTPDYVPGCASALSSPPQFFHRTQLEMRSSALNACAASRCVRSMHWMRGITPRV